jgi:SAM-dependent methyltransferase
MQPATPYAEALAPVAECMLAEARIVAGERVLDVGSGSGDMALLAAQAAGPLGHVLATDVSRERMSGLIARIGGISPPPPIAVVESPAEALALEPGTFDVALGRNCVMYFRNLGQALARVHDALRPGGRIVASVYGPLEREPFHAIPIEAVTRRRPVTVPPPEYVQAFRVDAAAVHEGLVRAGFATVRTRVVEVQRTYASLQAALAGMRRSPSLGELMSTLPAEQREEAWRDIEHEFGRYEGPAGLRIPGEQVVIVGIA